MNVLRVPLRINLIGGWTDQLGWTGTKAVVNASIGWHGGKRLWRYDPYPMVADANGVHCKVAGIGTGLGISSIREAARYLYTLNGQDAGARSYIQHALEWERANGTLGGWQDQIGAIEGGFKLITTEDHHRFNIRRRDDHPILDRLVLFDTGERRPAKVIGDRVRHLMSESRSFAMALEVNARDTLAGFCGTADDCIEIALEGWARLTGFVPGMDPILDPVDGSLGYMLVGAGGGGWGVHFAKSPEERQRIIETLRLRKMEAYIPVLLSGAVPTPGRTEGTASGE